VKVRPTRPERYRKETELVANPDFSAPAVFVCFRVSGPDRLEGLWLAFSPSVLGFPRTLGFSASELPDDSEFSSSWAPLLHFDAASASCFPRAAHLLASHADHEPLSASTSLCAFGPTAFADPGTPFLAPFRGRPTGFTLPAGGPARRVWLPFQRCSVPKPSEASFSPQRSRASPFRAFLRPGDRKPVSRFPLRSRAFPQNPSALCRRLSGFVPPCQPCPSLLPECLIRVGARLLSWAF